MSIAVFAHSTNPRGGVVHALQLAETLCDAGREAVLLAPTLPGGNLFRTARCRFIPIPAAPVAGVAEMVARRITEIGRFLTGPGAPRFDIHHAQDPISANALADLSAAGAIDGFVRTVHHLDHHADARLAAWQERAVRTATALCCVSRLWQTRLRQDFGRRAAIVGNGVDTRHFSPHAGERDKTLRSRLGVSETGRVLLAVGGVEPRKNTLNIFHAFQRLHPVCPDIRLLIAGGATLLDHRAHRAALEVAFARTPAAEAVHLAGIVDDADMPALYRLADALVFPSREEGFGLCALEAMASGVPAIVSAIAPFTEHFGADEVLFTDPDNPASIAAAMHRALDPAVAAALRARGPLVAARFGWDRVAAAHLPLYDAFAAKELLDA